jgi:hypothetical protein
LPPELSRSRQSEWIGFPRKSAQARINENPRGVFSGLARGDDIFPDYRSAEDMDNDRRRRGLLLRHPAQPDRVPFAQSLKISQLFKHPDVQSIAISAEAPEEVRHS